MAYQHPDLKLRMSLYNFYLKKFANIKNKDEVARYCSKYDFDKVIEARRGKEMDKKLEKLFDDYEGNLLNYFCGLTPKQSKEFNKRQKKWRKK